MNLGSVIKDIRKKKGQTQVEFANACGITQTYLSQIESNLKEPNLSTLKSISEELGMPLPILFFLSINEDDVKPNKVEALKTLSPSVRLLVDEFFPI
nr:helix-turn-helix transcriptional regulator [uncultured Mucilaginibacter sp.]